MLKIICYTVACVKRLNWSVLLACMPGGGRGGGYSLIWPIQGCAAGQGMVFVLSVLNRVYNFAQVCPKQGQFPLSLSKTVCMICASAFVPSRSNDCNMIFSIAIAINDFKTTRRAFCPLS